jgi:6-pyruvoyl-tetrahydropterin synthase
VKPDRFLWDKWRPFAMEMKVFVKAALKKVTQKVADGSLDKHEEGYDDTEEMLLDWIWIELKEESPDKDAVINMELDDLYEVIESSAEIYEDYQILLENIRSENE